MLTTPPKKGKKRQAPQTPSGKPPAKGCPDPTSFAVSAEQSAYIDRLAGSSSPAVPLATSHSTRTSSPTPTGSGVDTADMLTDEEPSSFTIPSVEGALQEDEVESSFKELQDWTRYIAQHQEQRQRLLSFTVQVADSLKALLGGAEEGKPTTYAAAAATSAPRPRNPKKAGAAPTTKLIQHAITCYERASKELPGAPRDTLLKVVTSSNLNTAPTPLQDAARPKKRPSCLVQGIRTNTVAVRLPDGAKVPPSLPAIAADVNVNLKRMGFDEHIKEIQYGIRCHLNLVFDQTVSEL